MKNANNRPHRFSFSPVAYLREGGNLSCIPRSWKKLWRMGGHGAMFLCRDNANVCGFPGFQISEKWANLPLPLNDQKLKMFELQGGITSWPGALPLDSAGGSAPFPKTPVINSRSPRCTPHFQRRCAVYGRCAGVISIYLGIIIVTNCISLHGIDNVAWFWCVSEQCGVHCLIDWLIWTLLFPLVWRRIEYSKLFQRDVFFFRAAVGMGIPMGIPMGMGMVWVWGLWWIPMGSVGNLHVGIFEWM